MKTSARILAVMVLFCAAIFAANATSRAADTKKPAPPPDLQFYVDVPPTWRPFLDDDIAEAFASRVEYVFKQRGYAGLMAFVQRNDEPKPKLPVLEVRLLEWRISRTGNAECTFSATLKNAAAEKSLGLVANTAIFWPTRGGHWGMGRSFEAANALDSAAERALRELYQRVAETGLIPGLVVKQ